MNLKRLYYGKDKSSSITRFQLTLNNVQKKKKSNGYVRLPISEMEVDLEKTHCLKLTR